MGLALDEAENTKEILHRESDIDILMDNDIKRFVDMGNPIHIEYHKSRYGEGFYINTGSSC